MLARIAVLMNAKYIDCIYYIVCICNAFLVLRQFIVTVSHDRNWLSIIYRVYINIIRVEFHIVLNAEKYF